MNQKSVLLALCLSISTHGQAAENIITAVSDPYCPYTCEPGSDAPGFMTEVVKAIFEEEGYQINYEAKTWSRAVNDTRTGKSDILLGLYLEDAPDLVFPEEIIGKLFMSFYVSKNNPWKYGTLNTLDNMKIGLILDYAYNDFFDEYIVQPEHNIEAVRISGVNTILRRGKMIINGYIDAMVEDKYVVRYALRGNPIFGDIKEAGLIELEGHDVYVAFSPSAPSKSKRLSKIFDTGFKNLRNSPDFDRITEKYGIDYWSKK